jgi:hypothetical protein
MKLAIAIKLTVCWLAGTALAVTERGLTPQPHP